MLQFFVLLSIMITFFSTGCSQQKERLFDSPVDCAEAAKRGQAEPFTFQVEKMHTLKSDGCVLVLDTPMKWVFVKADSLYSVDAIAFTFTEGLVRASNETRNCDPSGFCISTQPVQPLCKQGLNYSNGQCIIVTERK